MRYCYRLLKDREIVVREEFLQEEGEEHSSEIYNRPEKNRHVVLLCFMYTVFFHKLKFIATSHLASLLAPFF